MADSDYFLVVSVDGSYFSLGGAYLVDTREVNPEVLQSFYDETENLDSFIEENGVSLPKLIDSFERSTRLSGRT